MSAVEEKKTVAATAETGDKRKAEDAVDDAEKKSVSYSNCLHPHLHEIADSGRLKTDNADEAANPADDADDTPKDKGKGKGKAAAPAEDEEKEADYEDVEDDSEDELIVRGPRRRKQVDYSSVRSSPLTKLTSRLRLWPLLA